MTAAHTQSCSLTWNVSTIINHIHFAIPIHHTDRLHSLLLFRIAHSFFIIIVVDNSNAMLLVNYILILDSVKAQLEVLLSNPCPFMLTRALSETRGNLWELFCLSLATSCLFWLVNVLDYTYVFVSKNKNKQINKQTNKRITDHIHNRVCAKTSSSWSESIDDFVYPVISCQKWCSAEKEILVLNGGKTIFASIQK